MIKTGDLVGWFDGGFDERLKPEQLHDFGVVVSVFSVKQHFGFPEISKIKIAWALDPDQPIDEYPFSWATGEMKKGALVILNQS
jgi:hypothetical protein